MPLLMKQGVKTMPKVGFKRKDTLEKEKLIEFEKNECQRFGYMLLDQFLGSGSYAKVFLAQPTVTKMRYNSKLRDLKENGKELHVAMKIVDVEKVSKNYIDKHLPREVSTLSQSYGHRNIIKLVDFFATRKRIYLVLEYAPCGDLRRMVNRGYKKKGKGAMTEDIARELFRDIVSGVGFLHSIHIAHRDLKLENILLGSNNTAKLSDFGFAFKKTEDGYQNTHCGSYAYVAPEVLKRETYEAKSADIWSLGIILYGLVQGTLPYNGSTPKETLEALKSSPNFKREVSEECKDLFKTLLNKDPCNRPNSEDILNHPWFYLSQNSKGFGDCKTRSTKIRPYQQKHVSHKTSRFDDLEYISRYVQKALKLDTNETPCVKETATSNESTEGGGGGDGGGGCSKNQLNKSKINPVDSKFIKSSRLVKGRLLNKGKYTKIRPQEEDVERMENNKSSHSSSKTESSEEMNLREQKSSINSFGTELEELTMRVAQQLRILEEVTAREKRIEATAEDSSKVSEKASLKLKEGNRHVQKRTSKNKNAFAHGFCSESAEKKLPSYAYMIPTSRSPKRTQIVKTYEHGLLRVKPKRNSPKSSYTLLEKSKPYYAHVPQSPCPPYRSQAKFFPRAHSKPYNYKDQQAFLAEVYDHYDRLESKVGDKRCRRQEKPKWRN